MKVSIVMPVYNAEKFLDAALQSCINQTYDDLEVIIVIHDCTDSSEEILKKYSDKVKIISEHGIGAVKAVNIGLKSASGKWLKIMATDYIIYPNAIEELILELNNIRGEKENTLLYSNYDEINENGQLIKSTTERDYGSLSRFDRNVLFLNQSFPNMITTLFPRSVFEKYGYCDEIIEFGADYELWLRLFVQHNCNLHQVPKSLLKYRRHENQLSTTLAKKNPNAAETINKIILNKLEESEHKRYEEAIKEYQLKNKKSLYQKTRKSVGSQIRNKFVSLNK